MLNILIYSILFIEILLAIYIAINFQDKVKDSFAVSRQTIISLAFSVEGFSYIGMLFCSSEVLRYFLYTISWYAGIVLLANFVTMAAYSINYNSDTVKYSISIIYYLGLIIYFVDTYIGKGKLLLGPVGIVYPTFTMIQIILHTLLCAVFIASLAMIYSNYSIKQSIKREQYLLLLWGVTFSFIIVGGLFEFVELLFYRVNIPFVLLICIGTILLMPKLMIYHRSITFVEEDYDDYLKSDNANIVFVCDDEYNIRFMNKRAVIAGQVIKENFRGRNISDIYLIAPEIENSLYDNIYTDVLRIPAVYSPLDRNITLEIRPYYDKFKEIFASVVTVYGMENVEANTVPIDKKENSKISSTTESNDAYNILSNSRVLIINENSIRLNVFEKMLQPYNLKVNRSTNVQTAYREIVDNTYDIIFVDQNISGITPFDFVKKIRALNDNYYSMVPICLCADKQLDDQYKTFFDAGFSDYLVKPISAKQLNLVLTRWLWKRYEKEQIDDSKLISIDSDTRELRMLLEDCNFYYDKKNNLLLTNCLRAIRQQCVLLNLDEYEHFARRLYKSVILDDLVFFEKNYNDFQSRFLKALDNIENI